MSGPRLPVIRRVTNSAGEENEFVGIDGGEDAVFGVAADHAEAVDEHADEEVGLAERFAVLPRDDATIDEGSQRLHRVGGAQDRESMAMHDLKVLDGVLDIDDTSWAMFEGHRTPRHELLQLLPTQVERRAKVPRFAAVDITVAMGFDALAESGIACDVP